MPSTSKKQHNLMEGVAHNPAFAKRVGIPQSVGQDFASADKGKTFSRGGSMKMKETMGPRGMGMDVEKGSNKLLKHGESAVQKRGHTRGKELGITGPTEPIQKGMKHGGKVHKYAKGGVILGEHHGSVGLKKGHKGFGEHSIQVKGHTKGKNV